MSRKRPLTLSQFISGTRALILGIPVPKVERNKSLAFGDVADRRLHLYTASGGADCDLLTVLDSELFGVMRRNGHCRFRFCVLERLRPPGLGARVEVECIPARAQRDGILGIRLFARRDIVAMLEDGFAVDLHCEIFFFGIRGAGLQVVTKALGNFSLGEEDAVFK